VAFALSLEVQKHTRQIRRRRDHLEKIDRILFKKPFRAAVFGCCCASTGGRLCRAFARAFCAPPPRFLPP
jgi:hypothetical protein